MKINDGHTAALYYQYIYKYLLQKKSEHRALGTRPFLEVGRGVAVAYVLTAK